MINLSFISSNIPFAAAAFAAAVTAGFASLRYYSERAAKVTDFRKAWVESLRQGVAEFSGSTHTIAGRIAIRHKVPAGRRADDVQKNRIPHFGLRRKKRTEPVVSVETELATELLGHWSSLRLSYNKIVLHLNPAEHGAYRKAELAVSKFGTQSPVDESTRKDVSEFLHWCINVSEHSADAILDQNAFARFFRLPLPRLREDRSYTNVLIRTAQEEILKECNNSGSALLLAAFATRQLLHGSYQTVMENVERIEQGIRAVDTSAAIVIKGVWENIKVGEPAYRWAGRLAIVSSLCLIGLILAAFVQYPPPFKDIATSVPASTARHAAAMPKAAPVTTDALTELTPHLRNSGKNLKVARTARDR